MTTCIDWTEKKIAVAIARQTLDKKCVVLVDNCNFTGHECDVLGVTRDLRIIDVEIKISRSDLKADANKDKWWHRIPGIYNLETGVVDRPPDTKRSHPPKVWKHYYALPADIWKPELLACLPSAASGVLLLHASDRWPEGIHVRCARRATPARDAHRLTPEAVMAVARLANLRMWEAYKKAESLARDADHWRGEAIRNSDGLQKCTAST